MKFVCRCFWGGIWHWAVLMEAVLPLPSGDLVSEAAVYGRTGQSGH